MSVPLDSGINIQRLSNGVRSVSQTRLDTTVTCNRNAVNTSSNSGRKISVDSTTTLVTCESQDVEDHSYVMIHRPSPVTQTDERCSFTSKMTKCRLMASFLFILFVVILLYQVPVVLYYTNISPNIDDSDITDYVDFKTCSAQVDPAEAQPIELLLEECNNTMIGFGDNLDCDESAITGLSLIFTVGWYMENTECYYDSLQFFCDAALLLCNGNSSSADLTEECEDVRDDKCASEWRIVESFFNITAPDCTSYSGNGDLMYSKAPSLPCPSEFDHFCGSTCLPVCDGHYLLTENTLDLCFYIIAIITGAISLIGGVITLIACYYNQDRVLKIPQIYILYNTIVGIFIVVIENLPVVVGKLLVCSDRNYWIATIEPTNFCQTQGFIIQFCYGLFFGFWCFHLLHLLLFLAFPFKSKQLLDSSSRRRKVHITEVIIVILISIIPPIITLTVSQYESNGYYCYPQSPTVLFYGKILPSMLKLCVGFVLLFLILQVLRKEHHHWRSGGAGGVWVVSCMGYSIPEVKLIFIFCYYAINYLVYLTALVMYLFVLHDYGVNSFQYEFCSAGGYKEECEVYKERAESSFIPSTVMSILSVILFSVINLSHLMYVVQFLALKKSIHDKLKSWNCVQ